MNIVNQAMIAIATNLLIPIHVGYKPTSNEVRARLANSSMQAYVRATTAAEGRTTLTPPAPTVLRRIATRSSLDT